jgi:hypothetical protein
MMERVDGYEIMSLILKLLIVILLSVRVYQERCK